MSAPGVLPPIEECGIVFAVDDVVGDECPDCGGWLSRADTAGNRTCATCDTTFLGIEPLS